ncbi:HAD-IIIA family hydrolase [Marinobacter sp. DUT-1]|uniref:HAD-IIIA family hydrolase n=1 Tax=Marinobacter sp. DUT-1 TaxID=3412037 RepID=UPI003D1703EF
MDTKPVSAVIFDLDDTLIYTKSLQGYRENRDSQGMREKLDESSVFKPVANIVSELKKIGVPLAVVTNSPRWYVDILLNHHDLNVFDILICYDDVGPSGAKPSPRGIELALEKLGRPDPKTVIYVGDQDTDIVASYAAGVRPIAPSWATRRPIDQVPAAILNSETLLANLHDVEELALIADRVALNRKFDFPKSQMNFLPLNEAGQVVPLKREEIKLISFGRYFSQGSSLTARIHEDHSLSKDIFKKEESQTYILPEYYVDLIVKVVESLPQYAFGSDESYFDVVTVIPAKKEKNPRLENFLKRIQRKSKSRSEFIPDIFEFERGARSLKTLGGKEKRSEELSRNFRIKKKHEERLSGKTVLVLDDIITTGATFTAAFDLLQRVGVSAALGACLAKTVSIQEHQKTCPKCSRVMRVSKNGKTGIHFYSCTGFYEKDQCKYSEYIKIKECPRCGKDMKKSYNYREGKQFLTCTSYGTPEACGYTESVSDV